jgi:hypothetical protein
VAVIRVDRSLFPNHYVRTNRQSATNAGFTDNLRYELMLQCAVRAVDASQPLSIQQQDIRHVRKTSDLG